MNVHTFGWMNFVIYVSCMIMDVNIFITSFLYRPKKMKWNKNTASKVPHCPRTRFAAKKNEREAHSLTVKLTANYAFLSCTRPAFQRAPVFPKVDWIPYLFQLLSSTGLCLPFIIRTTPTHPPITPHGLEKFFTICLYFDPTCCHASFKKKLRLSIRRCMLHLSSSISGLKHSNATLQFTTGIIVSFPKAECSEGIRGSERREPPLGIHSIADSIDRARYQLLYIWW